MNLHVASLSFPVVVETGLLLAGPVPQVILAILSAAAGVVCLAAGFMQYIVVVTYGR